MGSVLISGERGLTAKNTRDWEVVSQVAVRFPREARRVVKSCLSIKTILIFFLLIILTNFTLMVIIIIIIVVIIVIINVM